ncbi:MAG: ECF transporter S component [Candidatus Nanohaloarchaea archaeon]
MPAIPATPDTPAIPEDLTSPEEEDSSDSLTEWKAATAALGLGIAGRVALQGFPSIETVTPLAIASGYYLGWKKGLYTGAAGFFLSNFLVWGGQGPWTVFQVLAAGSAGMTGAIFSSLRRGRYTFFSSIVSGILAYEIVINLGSMLYTPWAWASPVTYLAASVPFALIHLISSVGFGGVIYGFDSSLERIGG